jgi:hypothetical protein
LVIHTCNSSYLGGRDQEDLGLRPSPKWAKWTGGTAEVVELLLCKCKAPSSNPSPTGKKKKIKSPCISLDLIFSTTFDSTKNALCSGSVPSCCHYRPRAKEWHWSLFNKS